MWSVAGENITPLHDHMRNSQTPRWHFKKWKYSGENPSKNRVFEETLFLGKCGASQRYFDFGA